MKKIELPTKLLKGAEMVEYWNEMTQRIGASVMFIREEESGLFLSDRVYNALVFCHYKNKKKKTIDWIKLV